jgi:cardiolipin synthase A/B
LSLVAVTGCSMLRTIVPDMAPHSSTPVQLEGAREPLSAQQSKDILARLESRGEETNIFDRHLALEEGVVGTPLVVGNKVVLLKDGPATFQAMVNAIRIDGVWSTIGSTNLDWRSFLHNEEVNAVILGQEFGAQMQTMFDADLAVSDPITLEKWKQRPLGNRVKEIAARMWEYWL